MPGGPNNILCLIDTWAHLNTSIEQNTKKSICNFLQKISSDEWLVYLWSGSSYECDLHILKALSNTNYIETNNSVEVFKPVPAYFTYYYAGFHTNLCIFNNEIGISKFLQFNKENKFYIIEDLTCGLLPDDTPCAVKDLQYLNAGNCTFEEQELILQNLHLKIIKDNTIWSNDII